MKQSLTALVVAGSLATATVAAPTQAHARWGWGGWGWGLGGLAVGALIGAALTRPYYGYGYGYPAYGYGYGYPAYSYGYGYPAYGGYRRYYAPRFMGGIGSPAGLRSIALAGTEHPGKRRRLSDPGALGLEIPPPLLARAGAMMPPAGFCVCGDMRCGLNRPMVKPAHTFKIGQQVYQRGGGLRGTRAEPYTVIGLLWQSGSQIRYCIKSTALELSRRGAVTMFLRWPQAPFVWLTCALVAASAVIQLAISATTFRETLSRGGVPAPHAGRRTAIAAGALLAALLAVTAFAGGYFDGIASLARAAPIPTAAILTVIMLAAILFLVPIAAGMGLVGVAGAALLMGAKPALLRSRQRHSRISVKSSTGCPAAFPDHGIVCWRGGAIG